jgi:prevent-host-death family protein
MNADVPDGELASSGASTQRRMRLGDSRRDAPMMHRRGGGNTLLSMPIAAHEEEVAIMTMYDYLMVMKPIRVAEFKAKLSEYLRSVRRGHELTIYDRDQPIARVIPIAKPSVLSVREPAVRYATLGAVPLAPPLDHDGDIVDLLLTDRQSDR